MVGNSPNNATQSPSQLRLVGESAAQRLEQPSKAETLHAWSPGDSISHAEDALAHAERKMANLRLLLSMPDRDPDRTGPWAA